LKLVKEEVQEGMANVIDDVRNGRAQILYIDGIAYAVFVRGAENAAEGFVQKYVEIPIDLIRTLSGEMTAQEFLFESAEGYIPVVILGYAGAMKEAIITKSFAPLKARILFRSILYPIEGPLRAGRYIAGNVFSPTFRALRQGTSITSEIKASAIGHITEDIARNWTRFRYNWGLFRGNEKLVQQSLAIQDALH